MQERVYDYPYDNYILLLLHEVAKIDRNFWESFYRTVMEGSASTVETKFAYRAIKNVKELVDEDYCEEAMDSFKDLTEQQKGILMGIINLDRKDMYFVQQTILNNPYF